MTPNQKLEALRREFARGIELLEREAEATNTDLYYYCPVTDTSATYYVTGEDLATQFGYGSVEEFSRHYGYTFPNWISSSELC